jgi:GcrA cell cycle regulator
MTSTKTHARWTDEAVETLRTLWVIEGISASVIAKRLGVTRNAVIGKVHRLGLSTPRGPKVARTAAVRKPREVRPPLRVVRTDRTALALEVAGPGLIPHLEDLPRCGCHWPVGDPQTPDFAFCGRPASRGPYCAAHGAVAYRGPGVSVGALMRLVGR